MFNKYLNTSGKVFIMIKAASDYSIAGKNYVKGQLVTTIEDADFQIQYNTLGKAITSKTFLMGYTDFEPKVITIEASNITSALADILFTYRTKDVQYNIPESEWQTTDTNGEVYLNNIPVEDTIFIYDIDKNRVTEFTIDETGAISGLDPESKYYFTYYVNTDLNYLYNIGKNSIPYFTIEIVNEINYGADGRKLYIEIPRCSLEIDPVLNFAAIEVTSLPLTFHIIDGKINLGIY